jgi:hypothetical protein
MATRANSTALWPFLLLFLKISFSFQAPKNHSSRIKLPGTVQGWKVEQRERFEEWILTLNPKP